MLTYFYTNFGGYMWAAIIAVITYFVMNLVKKSYLPITKKLCSDEKSRRIVNLFLGVAFSVGIGLVLGKFGNLLFGSSVHWKWFVGGGLLATLAYLMVEKYRDADATAFGKEYQNAVMSSNLDIDVKDFPKMTKKIREMVEAFDKSTDNKHNVLVDKVAESVASSVEISTDEENEILKAVEKLKSAGYDVSGAEKEIEKAREDGKFTEDEKRTVLAALEAIRKTID